MSRMKVPVRLRIVASSAPCVTPARTSTSTGAATAARRPHHERPAGERSISMASCTAPRVPVSGLSVTSFLHTADAVVLHSSLCIAAASASIVARSARRNIPRSQFGSRARSTMHHAPAARRRTTPRISTNTARNRTPKAAAALRRMLRDKSLPPGDGDSSRRSTGARGRALQLGSWGADGYRETSPPECTPVRGRAQARRNRSSRPPSGPAVGHNRKGGAYMPALLMNFRLSSRPWRWSGSRFQPAGRLSKPTRSIDRQLRVKEISCLRAMRIISWAVALPDAKSYNLEQPPGRDGPPNFHEGHASVDRPFAILGMLARVLFYLNPRMVKVGRGVGPDPPAPSIIRALCALDDASLLHRPRAVGPQQHLRPSSCCFPSWAPPPLRPGRNGENAHNFLSFPFTLAWSVILLMWISWNLPTRSDVEC